MNTKGQRIRHIREEVLKEDQAKFGSRFGVTNKAVSQWESDKTEPTPKKLSEIARLGGQSIDWVENGGRTVVPVGEEFSPDAEFSVDPKTAVSTLKPYKGETKGAIPDIDVSAGAGPGGLPLPASTAAGGALFSADAIRGEIVLPPYILGEFTRAMAARVHMVRVRGDSMEPTLLAGDRVLVDTTDQAIGQGGAFVLLDPDGEVLVKRLRKRGAKIEVISDNPKQGSDTYPADDVRIIGRVVARLSRV